MELVAEMRGHWSSQPVPWLQSSREHSETIRAMDAASTEDERDRIWHESTERMMERSTREQQQLSALFGDRMRYVLGEYQRRGMIDRSEARHVEWLAQSKGWLPEAANTLGALARRL